MERLGERRGCENRSRNEGKLDGGCPQRLDFIPQIPEEYDLTVLTQFVRIFPEHPLAQIVAAYFTYQGIPLEEEDEEGVVKKKSGEDEEDYTSLILVSSLLVQYTESSSPDLGYLS